MWWPKNHTVSQDKFRDIVFEPFVGGRIYESDADGAEHDWGEITVWDPPHRVDYLWHIFFEPKDGTDISVTFTPTETGVRIRLHQDGFDRLATEIGAGRRDRVEGAWHSITGLYREALV
jgi:uncharacterized protein YndB with AHSA1/START domain